MTFLTDAPAATLAANLLLATLFAGCQGSQGGPDQVPGWLATYAIDGERILRLSSRLVNDGEQLVLSEQLALDGPSIATFSVDLDVFGFVKSAWNPCSARRADDCIMTTQDTRYAGAAPMLGVYLPQLVHDLPPVPGLSVQEDHGLFTVEGNLSYGSHGALASGQYRYGDRPVPEEFSIRLGEGGTLNGRLTSWQGEVTWPLAKGQKAAPRPDGPMVPAAFPGSATPIPGLGFSPDAAVAALLGHPEPQARWQNEGCLRSFKIYLHPSLAVGTPLGLPRNVSYHAEAVIEEKDGTATLFTYDLLPVMGQVVATDVAEAPSRGSSECRQARSKELVADGAAFLAEAVASNATRGKAFGFAAYVVSWPALQPHLHYRVTYDPEPEDPSPIRGFLAPAWYQDVTEPERQLLVAPP